MLSTKNPRVDYDSKFDVMHYSVGDTSNVYGDEDIDNIVVLKDMDSDEIIGYTIMNFKKMIMAGSESLDSVSYTHLTLPTMAVV